MSAATPGSEVVPAPAAGRDGISASPLAERPEMLVGAAFVGGFVLAMILKRLGP